MRSLNFRVWWWLPASLLLLATAACRAKKRILKSPPHYNFSEALIDKLELKLREISGIAWDPKSNVFLAINDESGKLFFLDKESKLVTAENVFGDNGDYEDVAIYNGIPYILKSDGSLTKFMRDSTGKTYGVPAGKVPLSGTNDFETLYADPSRHALVLVCKNCKTDDEKSVSAFAYYPDSIGFDNKPLYVIDADAVARLSPAKSSKFQPSAGAIHPITKQLFLLSSASNQLLVADPDGRPQGVYILSKKLFPQAEGITFKQNGDMYISNEGMGSKATLLKFPFRADTAATAKGGTVVTDFSKPDEVMELHKQLTEISGMSWVPGKNILLTENDEKGDIFQVDFANRNDELGKIKFGGKGDYEDIVYTDTAVYMLVSNGTIIQVMTRDSSFSTREFTLPGDKNEFESMYLEPDTRSLVLLCKECAHEKKTEVRTAYRFSLSTLQFAEGPAYAIPVSDIRKILNDEGAEFKPSAAGINPVPGKLYILASVGKMLVIADRTTGRPEQVFRLDPTLYNQPEGLAFAPNGDLYISNEGGGGVATILKFNAKK